MNELVIEDKFPNLQRLATLFSATFLGLWSFYTSFSEVLASRYSTLFYIGIIGLIVAVFSIFSVTIWLPKPLFVINSESIAPNLADQTNLKPIFWSDVADVNIGLNFLKIDLKNAKTVNIDLSSLRYVDLKSVKSSIMEYCEAKQIPYKNA